MSDAPFVYVLSLNWNGELYLQDFCETILAMDYPNFRVALVDNASSDGSIKFLQEHFPDIEIIRNTTNLGYAAGYNVGIMHALDAGAEYFFILNNDTVIPRDTLTNLIHVALSDARIGFVTGKVYFSQNPRQLQTVGKKDSFWRPTIINVGQNQIDDGQFESQHDYDYLDDVFWLVRRDVITNLGGYDPEFFLYWEETDWCARAKGSGFRLVYTPTAHIFHKGSQSTGGGDNPRKGYYIRRNALLFYWRHKSKAMFLFKGFLVFLSVVQPRRLAAFLLKGRHGENIRAEWKGMVDGLKHLASGRFS